MDEYSVETTEPPTVSASLATELSPFKQEQECSVALNGGPSFAIACREASIMVPFNMKRLLDGANANRLQLRLPPPSDDRPPKSTKAKKQQANPNRVRDEAQYEVAFLRGKVAQLELQLRNLQLNAALSGDFLAVPRPIGQVPRVWKEMAKRQRRRRDEAQRENIRLRLIVERKRKMATGFSALLRKRLTQQVRSNF